MTRRRLPVFSASRVEDFELCPRKWAWRALYGVEGKRKGSLELGTRVHAWVETWLRGGEIDLLDTLYDPEKEKTHRPGLLALALTQHAPGRANPWRGTPEAQGLVIEGTVRTRIPTSRAPMPFTGFTGKKDLELCSPLVQPRRGSVWDWKTTNSIANYAPPDGAALLTMIQPCVYAFERLTRPGAEVDETDLSWVYVETGGPQAQRQPKTKKIEALGVTLADVAPTMLRVIDACTEMQKLFLDPPATGLEVNANWQSCGEYGGCAYAELCTDASAEKVFVALMAQGLPAWMNQAHAAAQAAPQPPPGPPPAQPPPGPQPAALVTGGPPDYPPQGLPGPGGYVMPPEAHQAAAAQAAQLQALAQQTGVAPPPPPGPPPGPPPSAPPGLPPGYAQNPITGQLEPLPGSAQASTQLPLPAPQSAPAAEAKAKGKRGRPATTEDDADALLIGRGVQAMIRSYARARGEGEAE